MKLCPEGWPFVIGPLCGALALMAVARNFHSITAGVFAGLAILAAGFCAYFFRDPPRTIPKNDKLILSPADGKVMEIVETNDLTSTTPVQVIRIFLSVFDPHLQRMPVAGRVSRIQYTEGKFLDARDPRAAFENEQNRVVIDPDKSSNLTSKVVVTQIAGLIARRIVCNVTEGQTLAAGDKIGLIRFGSQVDMIVPKNVVWKVRPGDRVLGGQTVLAEIAG